MRHAASMVAAMEGMSRAAFRIARELANNSRSGLTSRFLAKKLDIPEEEVEYLVDVNHRLLFTDLTKIKIVAEGINVVARVTRGLENLGDGNALCRQIKAMTPHDFRHIEELLGLDGPCPKKTVIDELFSQCYSHPDSVVTYVASRGFSSTARELFDLVWQSKDNSGSARGVMPVAKLRTLHGGSEYDIEQGLWELFQGQALFEMFRFDAEDRLARHVGLLAEIRQWRESAEDRKNGKGRLRPSKGAMLGIESHGVDFSDRVCRLVATIAAHPVRVRGDGDLFREDRRRLAEICGEDEEPSLATCLWAAQGLGWLARVDNELRAGELDALVAMSPLERHKLLFDWLMGADKETHSLKVLTALMEELKPGAWYPVLDAVRNAMAVQAEDEQPVLRNVGGYWHYASTGTSPHSERALVRLFEETLFWLGVVDRAEEDGDANFRVTDLGLWLLAGTESEALDTAYPTRRAEIVVQPNFDIVVPTQDTDPLLAVPLDQFAVRTSTGSATVYTLSKDSFTRAIQDGHDGRSFVEFLLAHNRGALPSNVLATLEDWSGGMKRVRLRTIQVLEADDPLVLADLLHRRRFKKLFEELDPHRYVTYNGIARSELAKHLEKDGFVVE